MNNSLPKPNNGDRLEPLSCLKRKIIIKGQLGIVTSRAWLCKIYLKGNEMFPGVGNKKKINSASQSSTYFFFVK